MLVEVPGFRTALRNSLELSVNQTATRNFKLELGAATQEVTVTAETPILETGTGDRGRLIDGQSIREFPLNGRKSLDARHAGVDFKGSLADQRPFDNGAIADWRINGSNHNIEFLPDGAPNNSQARGNNVAYVPPVDSSPGVQDLKDARGRLITIYDPATGCNVKGAWTRDAFPGNVIPKARISPRATAFVFRQASNDRTELRGSNGVREAGEDGQFALV